MSAWALFAAVFLACAVEAVEATTIVLAAGTARDWASAITGLVAAVLVLAAAAMLAFVAFTAAKVLALSRETQPAQTQPRLASP